ncbi:hypothetical protein F5888DRAFT_1805643 [Russula emetica]|nr:hypothetical protein F5888DRAFT_1805643 [Russula emetica]
MRPSFPRPSTPSSSDASDKLMDSPRSKDTPFIIFCSWCPWCNMNELEDDIPPTPHPTPSTSPSISPIFGTKEGARVPFSASGKGKINVEGCAQISKGECALVCQDVTPPAEGVTKLIVLDTLVWTASGSSSLRAGVHRLVAQSAPASQLSSHWPLWHRTHRRASTCHLHKFTPTVHHSRPPAISTITPPVSPAYHECCVSADLGATSIDTRGKEPLEIDLSRLPPPSPTDDPLLLHGRVRRPRPLVPTNARETLLLESIPSDVDDNKDIDSLKQPVFNLAANGEDSWKVGVELTTYARLSLCLFVLALIFAPLRPLLLLFVRHQSPQLWRKHPSGSSSFNACNALDFLTTEHPKVMSTLPISSSSTHG